MTSSGPQERATAGNSQFPGLDTTVANPARVWNYWVGGKDNFAVDREAGEQVLRLLPSMPLIARYARRFLLDAVRRLTADYGVRQFLDIGTGLPTADNTHDVAQRIAPESRIVYVDNDPVVLTHARALLTSNPEGETDYIAADLRDTRTILAGAEQTLDFSQPVAVLLIAMRTRAQVTRFFDGLDLVEPGVVPLDEWWAPGEMEPGAVGMLSGYAGIARKRRRA